MLAAGLLRANTAGQDATTHPAPAGYLLRQRSRRNRHSRRSQQLPEAVRRPALASGSRRTSVRVHPYFDAAKPKSRAGSRLSLPSRAPADRNGRRPLSVVHSAVCRVRIRRAVLRGRRVAADVDAPAGQPGREPGVLALLADGQRQLEIGYHHPRRAAGLVDDRAPTPPWPATARWRRTWPGPRRSR